MQAVKRWIHPSIWSLCVVGGVFFSASYSTILEAIFPAALLLLFIGFWVWRWPIKQRTGYEAGFALFLFAAIFSAGDAYLPGQAWADVANTIVSLLFVYILYAGVKKVKFQTLLKVLFYGVALLLIVGVVQIAQEYILWVQRFAWLNVLNDRTGPDRVCSLFLRRSGTNVYACFLALMIPIYLGWLSQQWRSLSRGIKLLHAFLLLCAVINVTYTYSRALFVSFAVIMAHAVFYSKYRHQAILGLSVFVVAAFIFVAPFRTTVTSLFNQRDDSNRDHSASFTMSLQLMAQHPWNGWGGGHVKTKLQKINGVWTNVYGTYKNKYEKLRGFNYQKIQEQALRDGVIIVHSPHNIFFYFFISYGFPGLIAFLVIVATVYGKLRNIQQHTTDPLFQACARSMFYGLTALLVYSFFQDSLITTIMGLLFWIFLVLVVRLEDTAVLPHYRKRYAVRILAYHRILPETGDQTLAVNTALFEKQLLHLKRKRYTFLTLQQYYKDYLRPDAEKEIQRNICILTFDDGYMDNYLYAVSILKKHNIPATFFITTGYVGKTVPYYWDLKHGTKFQTQDFSMTWDSIRELQAAGMDIGAHTVSHFELPRLTATEIQNELVTAKREIEKQIKTKIISFCYPRGQQTQQILALTAAAGYQVGVVTPSAGHRETPLSLSRIGLYGHDTWQTFLFKISWAYPLLRGLRR